MLFACVNILLGLEIASDHADIDTDICHVCGTDSFPKMRCHLEASVFSMSLKYSGRSGKQWFLF